MPDSKISQLPDAAPLAGGELLPMVQGGDDVKATPQLFVNLLRAILGKGAYATPASLNFADYPGLPPSGSGANKASYVQLFGLNANVAALQLNGFSLDDQFPRAAVTTYYDRQRINLADPVVLPEETWTDGGAKFIRDGSTGSLATNPAGTYYPAMQLVPHAHIHRVGLYCNPDGNPAHSGAGIVAGKNWTLSATTVATIVDGGSGHAVGDVVTFPNPSKAPYLPFKYTVASVDGSGKALSLAMVAGSNQGAYALPPALQATQWVRPDFLAVYGQSVFAGNVPLQYAQANTTGTGTGLVVDTTGAWAGDYDTPGYFNFGQTLQADAKLGEIRVTAGPGASQPQSLFSSTYGPQFAMQISGLNYQLDRFACNNFGVGLYLRSASDTHCYEVNPVKCRNAMQVFAGGSIRIDCAVFDSCGSIGSYDQCQGFYLKGRAFYASSNVGIGPTAGQGQPSQMQVGLASNASKPVRESEFDLRLQNQGALVPIFAASLGYCVSSSFRLHVTNYAEDGVGSAPYLLKGLYILNAGFDATNELRGYFDGGPTNLFGNLPLISGSVPNCLIDIRDQTVNLTPGTNTAVVSGSAASGDVLTITFTNAYATGFPFTVTYTAGSSETTTTLAAGLAAAINAHATAIANKITATSSGFNLTVTMPSIGTTMAFSRTGTGSEAVAFNPASGVVSGAATGGQLVSGNVYRLAGVGAPTAYTGFYKANAGSEYVDLATGQRYRNTGTASAPSWT
ncbi:MAG: hypothetical protein U0835_00170 [Isosphaeraceae bacterium]